MPVLWLNMDMKLSPYARRAGVTYKTAWRWYKAGMLDAYQTPTGTIVVREEQNLTPTTGRIALYARVSSADQKDDVAVITSMAARLYGRWHTKQRTTCIQQYISQCLADKYENHTRL